MPQAVRPADGEIRELAERLRAGGDRALVTVSQDEIARLLAQLPVALETEGVRERIPELVARVDVGGEIAFRRMVDVARDNPKRAALLIEALRRLPFRGAPDPEEFEWLVRQMSSHPLPTTRLDAYLRIADLRLTTAQRATVDSLASRHPDIAVREASAARPAANPPSGEDRAAEVDRLLDRDPGDADVRRELLQIAFDRETLDRLPPERTILLGRWLEARAREASIDAGQALSALRRAAWVDGEPPRFDDTTRPIVRAATHLLKRARPEERARLFGKEFTLWLFAAHGPEEASVLDDWAADPSPSVAEGLFRALAAMHALAGRLGVVEPPTALDLALGIWDRASEGGRPAMARALAAGWSRGFLLDRRRFFEAFWKRYQEQPGQRDALLVVLESFEAEIDRARANAPTDPGRPRSPAKDDTHRIERRKDAAAQERDGLPLEDESVLPAEPLPTLRRYLAFLDDLATGRSVDELLVAHRMDFSAYARCMSAWGRVLKSRPELAVRMGQILRGPGPERT